MSNVRVATPDTLHVMRPLRNATILTGAIACAIAPWPPLWLSDLLAAFAPWIAVLAAAAAAALLLSRWRWWAAVPLTLGCSAALLTFLAPRAPRAAPEGAAISILVINNRAGSLEQMLALLQAHKADIAVVVEAPWGFSQSTLEEAGYRWRRIAGPRDGRGVRAILSQWPGEEVSPEYSDEGVFGAVLQLPDGPIAVVAAHPQSARTPARWRQGNRVAEAAADFASELEARGAPTLIAADFNSPPTGLRSRRLGDAGFRRARPLWPPAGSYPSWAPPAMGLAIDGVAAGEGFFVRSWRAIEAPGSDHRAVLVELVLDRAGS